MFAAATAATSLPVFWTKTCPVVGVRSLLSKSLPVMPVAGPRDRRLTPRRVVAPEKVLPVMVAPFESMVTRLLPCSQGTATTGHCVPVRSGLMPPAVPEMTLLVKVMLDVAPPPEPPPITTSCRGTLASVNCWPKP